MLLLEDLTQFFSLVKQPRFSLLTIKTKTMKPYVLLLASVFVLSFTKVNAQCTFLNPGIKFNSSQTQTNGGCLINFDLSFDLSHNNGNKWVTMHLWPTSVYPTLKYNKPPKSDDLADAVATIVIDQRAIPSIALYNMYQPDNAVPVQYTGLSVSRIEGATYDRYTITNISVLAPTNCTNAQSFSGDVWSSQADPNNVVHCVSQGFSFIANDPRVVASLNCLTRKYNVTITTVTSGVSGTYNVYRDNGDNVLDVNADLLVATDVPWSATSTTPYQSGPQDYAGSKAYPTSLYNLFVVATTVGLSNTTNAVITNGCQPLPVSLSDFSTSRKNTAVSLVWKTSTETNVDRFEIEKKVGNSFVTIGSVNAANIANGSAYSFIDNNSSTTYTEYRIKTIDMSGIFHYSDIRVVKGLGAQLDFTVYPNPSNGASKIVLTDIPALSSINITDLSGRVVKTYSNLNTNSLDIKGLQKGIYFIRLTNQNDVRVTTKKVVIN